MARQGFFIADMLGEKIGKFTVRRSDDFASLWIKNRYFVEIRFVYNTSCKNGIGLLVSVSDRDNNDHEVDHIINYYNFSVFAAEFGSGLAATITQLCLTAPKIPYCGLTTRLLRTK